MEGFGPWDKRPQVTSMTPVVSIGTLVSYHTWKTKPHIFEAARNADVPEQSESLQQLLLIILIQGR